MSLLNPFPSTYNSTLPRTLSHLNSSAKVVGWEKSHPPKTTLSIFSSFPLLPSQTMANNFGVLLKLVPLVFLCMLVNSPCGKADISCGTVASKLAPCLPYIQKGQGERPECCPNIRSLVSLDRNKADRQSVCKCLHFFASGFSDAEIQNAARLPGHCEVFTPYPIERNTDCSR